MNDKGLLERLLLEHIDNVNELLKRGDLETEERTFFEERLKDYNKQYNSLQNKEEN